MIGQAPELVGKSSSSYSGLSSLERLGAYFTSQIHDLNNQISVLSNAELLLPNEPLSGAMTEFIGGLFGAIQRISATCDQFNSVRKKYPVEMETISLRQAIEAIAGATEDCKRWQTVSKPGGGGLVFLNTAWLPLIVSQLIDHMQSESGVVEISIGELPPRQYVYPLRGTYNEGKPTALLVHFKGSPAIQEIANASHNFQIALELMRLQGAGISLTRSDSTQDYLLAFRLQRI